MCNLQFGSVRTDIVFDGDLTVRVNSNEPYTLDINGIEHRIKAGETAFSIK